MRLSYTRTEMHELEKILVKPYFVNNIDGFVFPEISYVLFPYYFGIGDEYLSNEGLC